MFQTFEPHLYIGRCTDRESGYHTWKHGTSNLTHSPQSSPAASARSQEGSSPNWKVICDKEGKDYRR